MPLRICLYTLISAPWHPTLISVSENNISGICIFFFYCLSKSLRLQVWWKPTLVMFNSIKPFKPVVMIPTGPLLARSLPEALALHVATCSDHFPYLLLSIPSAKILKNIFKPPLTVSSEKSASYLPITFTLVAPTLKIQLASISKIPQQQIIIFLMALGTSETNGHDMKWLTFRLKNIIIILGS